MRHLQFTPASLTIHALAALTAMLGACSRERPVDGLEAPAIPSFSLSDPAPAEAPVMPEVAEPGQDATRPSIRFTPATLRVYRATPVDLAAVPPVGVSEAVWGKATCAWTFGDGSPARDGCAISHTFTRGTSDERVTLTVRWGEIEATATQIVPLERLSVSGGAAAPAATGAIPPPPADAEGNVRIVVLSGTGHPEVAWGPLLSAVKGLEPDLVVHLGGVVGGGGAGFEPWEAAREALAEPLRMAGVPLVWALSPADLAGEPLVRRPSTGLDADALELAADSAFPNRYAFTFRGVYVAILSGAEQSKADLDWLRARLTDAQIYDSRIVFSHLPLHPFSAAAGEVLGPKFKLYELLLRTRVSALVSAGQGVFFDGRYGALPVVSVGRVAGPPVALAGHDFAQPPTFAVIDVVRGQLENIFALEMKGDGAWGAFDAQYLPETVEVYTR